MRRHTNNVQNKTKNYGKDHHGVCAVCLVYCMLAGKGHTCNGEGHRGISLKGLSWFGGKGSPLDEWEGCIMYIRCVGQHNSRVKFHTSRHGCGSAAFWYGLGSGSADPYCLPTDPDPAVAADPAFLSVVDKRPTIFFFAYYFLKLHLISVFKDKKSKRSHKIVETKVFLTF
jgi:hypothetical protein